MGCDCELLGAQFPTFSRIRVSLPSGLKEFLDGLSLEDESNTIKERGC